MQNFKASQQHFQLIWKKLEILWANTLTGFDTLQVLFHSVPSRGNSSFVAFNLVWRNFCSGFLQRFRILTSQSYIPGLFQGNLQFIFLNVLNIKFFSVCWTQKSDRCISGQSFDLLISKNFPKPQQGIFSNLSPSCRKNFGVLPLLDFISSIALGSIHGC